MSWTTEDALQGQAAIAGLGIAGQAIAGLNILWEKESG